MVTEAYIRNSPETVQSISQRVKDIHSNPEMYWNNNQERITSSLSKNFSTELVWESSEKTIEIATRVHGSPTQAQLVTLLDSLSRQETPGVVKRATILAHNLSIGATEFLQKVAAECGGTLHVVTLDSPLISGAYQSWHCMMLATSGNIVASFDADSALTALWSQQQLQFMQQHDDVVAAAAPMIKYNTRGVYALYSKGVEFLHKTPWLSHILNPAKQFRAGNMVARGDVVRGFATEFAGSRKEDTFFASHCSQQSMNVGFNSEAWTLNDGEALSEQKPIDSVKRIAMAVAWQLPLLKNWSRLNEMAARRYVIEDVSRYAPWTKPFIEQWAANTPVTQQNIIETFLAETVPQYRKAFHGKLSDALEHSCNRLKAIAETASAAEKHLITAADMTNTLDLIAEEFYKTAILELFESKQNK